MGRNLEDEFLHINLSPCNISPVVEVIWHRKEALRENLVYEMLEELDGRQILGRFRLVPDYRCWDKM